MTNEATANHDLARSGSVTETTAGFTRPRYSPHRRVAVRAPVSGGIVEQLLLEDAARELAAEISRLETATEWCEWRRTHWNLHAAVCRLLADCPARRKLVAAGQTANEAFTPPIPQKAQARGESRRYS